MLGELAGNYSPFPCRRRWIGNASVPEPTHTLRKGKATPFKTTVIERGSKCLLGSRAQILQPILSFPKLRSERTQTGSGSKRTPCLAEYRETFFAYPLRICSSLARNQVVRVSSPDEDISRAVSCPLRAPPPRGRFHRWGRVLGHPSDSVPSKHVTIIQTRLIARV